MTEFNEETKMNTAEYFDTSIPKTPNETEQILNALKTKQENLCERIQNVIVSEELSEACDVNDMTWLLNERAYLAKQIGKNIHDDDSVPKTNMEKYLDLYETLLNENNKHLQVVQFLKMKQQEQNSNLAIIKETVRLLETKMDITKGTVTKTRAQINLELFKRNSSKKFKELRNQLNDVLINYFEESMKQLLEDLTEAYFKGGDKKYVEKNNYHQPDIELLKNSKLVIEDPYDSSKIKFDDFV